MASAKKDEQESNSGANPSLKERKKSVAQPTSLQHFMLVLLMHGCKKLLLLEPMFRVGVYMCGVTVAALITDLVPLPKTYFANKRNIFNQWFVKIGWGWTLTVLGTFVFLTSYTYCCAKKQLVQKHMSRLLFATAWWYICTSVFEWVEHTTGFCSVSGHPNKKACIVAGGHWSGFDVSGHSFLLIHCALTISEEVRVMKFWSRIADYIDNEEFNSGQSRNSKDRLSSSDLAVMKSAYEKHTPYVRALVVGLTVLIVIWDIMLMATVLYFHNMPQKLTGGALAILGWFLTYRMWYLSNDMWNPGLPGKGPVKFKFMKDP